MILQHRQSLRTRLCAWAWTQFLKQGGSCTQQKLFERSWRVWAHRRTDVAAALAGTSSRLLACWSSETALCVLDDASKFCPQVEVGHDFFSSLELCLVSFRDVPGLAFKLTLSLRTGLDGSGSSCAPAEQWSTGSVVLDANSIGKAVGIGHVSELGPSSVSLGWKRDPNSFLSCRQMDPEFRNIKSLEEK